MSRAIESGLHKECHIDFPPVFAVQVTTTTVLPFFSVHV